MPSTGIALVPALALCLGLALAACGTKKSPTEYPDPPDPTATFTRIQNEIFTPSCALSGCHAGSAPARGMDLSVGRSYGMIVGVQAVVFLLEMTRPGFMQMLVLDRTLVMHGQVWRLITYLFIPPSRSLIWVIFALYWLHLIGTSLEDQWGSFRYLAYWAIGMLLTTVVAFAFDVPASNVYLLMSLFLAFATMFPEYEIRVFLIIPVRVKWLAMLDGAMLLWMVATADGLGRLVPVIAVGNYLLFFSGTLVGLVRRGAFRAQRAGAARVLREEVDSPVKSRRVCAVCGVTNEDLSIDFRVCTCEKCGGKPTEFCLKHARDH
ncbi:MAG: rhomboid family intramembrane serine protease [Deltaproteobacteria bacterium]